jgi:hypothetical protein
MCDNVSGLGNPACSGLPRQRITEAIPMRTIAGKAQHDDELACSTCLENQNADENHRRFGAERQIGVWVFGFVFGELLMAKC